MDISWVVTSRWVLMRDATGFLAMASRNDKNVILSGDRCRSVLRREKEACELAMLSP
jgi:hypothetical protein